jgi:NADPH:quinone reductase-like Zn-dependent oxidoreductase
VKAIQIAEFGGPEQLKLVEVPDPEPSDGMVVVDVLLVLVVVVLLLVEDDVLLVVGPPEQPH